MSRAHVALLSLILLWPAVAEPKQLTILHTNDIHSHMAPHGRGGRFGGDARIAALVNQVRATTGNVLLLDAGDWVEGTFYYRFNQPAAVDPIQWCGTADLAVMEQMGYDVIVLGNHDYTDFNRTFHNGNPPPNTIIERFQRSPHTFPVLSYNFVASALPTLEPYLVDQADGQPFALTTVGNVTVAMAGLTEELFVYQMYLADSVLDDPTPPSNPGSVAQPVIDAMNALSPDVTMLLNHIGHGEDRDIAGDTTGLDLIVGGHSHSRLFSVDYVQNPLGQQVPIVQAGSKSQFLGRLDLDIDDVTKQVTVLAYKLIPVDQNVPTDPAVGAYVSNLTSAVIAKNGNVFSDSVASMLVDIANNARESSIGNLVVDSVFAKTQGSPYFADMAWVSDGAISNPGEPYLDGLRKGNVTSEDVYRLYGTGYNPQVDANYRVFLVDYLGSELKWMQEEFNFGDAVASFGESLWIHMSGGAITYDPTQPSGQRIVSFTVGGQPVVDGDTYTVAVGEGELAVIDYLVNLGWVPFGYTNKRTTTFEVWRTMKDYLQAASPVAQSAVDIEGRYRTVQADLAVTNYGISITPASYEVGDTVSMDVTVWNYGERPSSLAGATLEVYRDKTPFEWGDDPSYDSSSLVGTAVVPSIGAFPTSTTVSVPVDTTGVRPGPNPLYVRLTGLSEPNAGNHFAFTHTDGLRIPFRLVTGPGPGPSNAPNVRVWMGLGTPERTADFNAYAAGGYGVNVATGDIDGTATDDEIITGPGPGSVYGPQVRAFRLDGTPILKINFYAYSTLRYGVNVAAGDIDRDGYAEIVTGAGPGAVFGPHVRAFNFDGAALTAISKVNFFAYSTLKWGVNVSSGDIDGDSTREILTAPGPGSVFSAQIRGFNYDGVSLSSLGKVNFNAYTTLYGGRVSSFNPDGDSYDEILTGPGPGGGNATQVRGFNYDNATIAPMASVNFYAYPSWRYGVRPAGGDVDADGRDEIVAGPGPDPAAEARAAGFNADAATPLPPAELYLLAYDPDRYGCNVAVAALAP